MVATENTIFSDRLQLSIKKKTLGRAQDGRQWQFASAILELALSITIDGSSIKGSHR
jgi:hypothetical protein